MRILIAVTSHLSYVLVRGQCRFLTEKGADVLFVSSYDSKVKKQVQEEGGFYRAIALKREIAFIADMKSVWEAIKIIRDFKPDIVNASTPKAGLVFMIASMFVANVYPIFTLRGLRSDGLVGFKKSIVKFTEYLSCKFAKKVIVISPSLKEHAIKEGIVNRNNAIVLGSGSSNGIDIKKFSSSQNTKLESTSLRYKYGIPDDGIVLGYIGRFVRDKGVIEIFHAFKILQATHENVYLIFTGGMEDSDPVPGPILSEMQQNKGVIFIPHTDDIPTIIASYDILILYSYREGFGNVCLEASAMGKPVIVSDIPGARDTIVNGVTGILVKSKDPVSLAKAMEQYIQNPSLMQLHGNAGRERVVSDFTNVSIWTEMYNLYSEVLKKM